jgi:hypothetical protein
MEPQISHIIYFKENEKSLVGESTKMFDVETGITFGAGQEIRTIFCILETIGASDGHCSLPK